MDASPGRSMRISLVQKRDCANFVVRCLNQTLPLINAFILNSPSTLNCPITAPTPTDQTASVSKANPSQIQTQGVSQPMDMLILPSSSFVSMTPCPRHQDSQQSSGSQFTLSAVAQGHTSHLPLQLPTLTPRLRVRAATHVLPLCLPALGQCQGLQSTEVNGNFPFGLKESPNPQGWRWEKKPNLRDADQHRTFSSSRISCQSFRDSLMPRFSFLIAPLFPPHLYCYLNAYNF